MESNSREKIPCKHCGKLIFFAVTRNGERQPLDIAPSGRMANSAITHLVIDKAI